MTDRHTEKPIARWLNGPPRAGTINTLVVTTEAKRLHYEDQKSIVLTFLGSNEADAATRHDTLNACYVNESRIVSNNAGNFSRDHIAEVIRSIDLFASFTGTVF